MKKPLLLAAALGATAADWQPAQLPQTAETTVTSAHSGRSYRIQTATIGEAPPAGYPVLYLLDGDTYFPYALPLAQTLLNPPGAGEKRALALVGIGYPGGKILDLAQRTRDYTPPLANGDGDSGDAEAFARFLDEELPPLLAARIPIDRSQQSLFGHSYGGLFALYHLYTRGTMRGYYLSSPSIWWESRRIDAFADRYHAPANRLTIRISAGSGEQAAPGDEKRRRRAMVENARALAAQLQQSQSDTTFTLLEGENHGSAAFAALKALLQTPGDSAP